MRLLMLLVSLVMVALAGLWFFTPVLDQTYARHAPNLSHGRSARAVAAPQSAPGSAQKSAPRAPATASTASVIASKNVLDNVMSMINAGTGLLGLWFGWMSYRLQRRDQRRA